MKLPSPPWISPLNMGELLTNVSSDLVLRFILFFSVCHVFESYEELRVKIVLILCVTYI